MNTKGKLAKRGWITTAVVATLLVPLAGADPHITIDWVTVGNAGNEGDTRYNYPPSYGAVAHEYLVSKYEITAGQYCEFLNAKAASDPFGLYNTSMWSSPYGCKIQRTDLGGTYSYSVAADWANRPVNYVSFWDAARFANWMHNGQGNSDTASGAYINIGNQATFARQPGALVFIPTEDEWYKAAYYDPNKGGPGIPGYWNYPTMSDTPPTNDLIDPDPGNTATFYDGGYTIGSPYWCTEVGAHENSASAYGTFDQGGNLWEFNETAIGSYRGLRGGSWYYNSDNLSASSRFYFRGDILPTLESDSFGFRLASPSEVAIPEPLSAAFMGSGFVGIAVAAIRRRRRRRA